MHTTYSFEDVTASFSHPSVGAASSTGAGVGTITTSMTQEKTVHDTASDGNVMISKIAGKNGSVAITLQQTSELHKFFMKWYNYVDNAPAAEWAKMNITIKSDNLGDSTVCTGVSPQKLADRPYQAQGQQITWNLMAAEISQT
ncbi:hypothetical protein CLPUN_42370 [Clostridium puniceum]|uniref:DUF3277 domain-containing protein n=1 Tax=Clostridium puniceum TaxID=29367 RepID=A0A1S8T8P3_9CLOT|nr:phage protein [Clostridium puniceum]OOM73999.1 hypothetical protein CLPUN_42370 [Clostridium puniceum]